jgi:hypothetical protein
MGKACPHVEEDFATRAFLREVRQVLVLGAVQNCWNIMSFMMFLGISGISTHPTELVVRCCGTNTIDRPFPVPARRTGVKFVGKMSYKIYSENIITLA